MDWRTNHDWDTEKTRDTLRGNDIRKKAYNLHRNLNEERVSLIETVAVKHDV